VATLNDNTGCLMRYEANKTELKGQSCTSIDISVDGDADSVGLDA